MKPILITILLALILAPAAPAVEPAPPSLESLGQEIDELRSQLRNARDQLDELQRSVDVIEERLGDSFRPPSPFNTIERRLEELEKDVDRLR